jgi:hypothetical protein
VYTRDKERTEAFKGRSSPPKLMGGQLENEESGSHPGPPLGSVLRWTFGPFLGGATSSAMISSFFSPLFRRRRKHRVL